MQGLNYLLSKLKYSESVLCFSLGVLFGALWEMLSSEGSPLSSRLLGGIFFVVCSRIHGTLSGETPFVKALISAFYFSGIQFVFGYIFNIALNLKLWDLSDSALHLSGQISIRSFILCFIFFYPASLICSYSCRHLLRAKAVITENGGQNG